MEIARWLTVLVLPGFLGAQNDALLTRVWNGIQNAQNTHQSGCGKIVETRTSALLAKPMVFRGTFCAEGLTRFNLEYTQPEKMRIRYNGDILNVTTGGGRHTEVMEVGRHVRRTQAYFSRETSLEHLKQNFAITVREEGRAYEMKLVPRAENFRRRLHHIVVQLGKDDFLLRSLEVDGKSGVKSVFAIELTSLDTTPPAGTFEVYKPR
jgi:hypothetical protein